MSKTILATNTFGLSKELTKDFDGTLRKVKELGIDAIEPIVFKHKKQGNFPKQLWTDELVDHAVKVCKELDLKLISSHFGAGYMGMTLPVKKLKSQLLEVHEKTGITTFISSGILNNERVAKKFATTMGELADELSPYGIKILFHNHDDEFKKTKSGEKTLLDVYFENTSDKVGLQLDLGWAAIGCGDELSAIRKYADRMQILHCKDFYAPDSITRKTAKDADFAPIGEGKVKYSDGIKLMQELGIQTDYVVIDQDKAAVNILDDLSIGIKNLRNMFK